MGTTYTVKFIGKDANSGKIKTKIDAYLVDFNQVFSTYISNSEISFINDSSMDKKRGGIPVSDNFKTVLSRAYSIYQKSEGNFDPTVYPLVKLWKFFLREYGGDGEGESKVVLPSDDEINTAKVNVGMNKVRLESGMLYLEGNVTLDFSAIAKGSAVDGVTVLLEREGYQDYMVEIGGEVRVNGVNGVGDPWRILISPPTTLPNDSQGSDFKSVEAEPVILSITNVAVATSGDYLNYFVYEGKKYSHLFNPLTGRPIKHAITSVSVILPDCESADAWATALIVMGEDGIAFSEKQKIPAIFMRVSDTGNIEIIKNSLVEKYLH